MDLPTRLESEHLTLRLFEESDAEAYKQLLDESREHLTRALGWGPQRFGSLEDARAEIRKMRANHAARVSVPLGIFAKEDGAFLGAVGLVRPDWEAGVCELGMWLGVNATGRGVASETARRVIRHAFEEMGLRRLVIVTDPANALIGAAARKYGFTFEGLKQVEPGPAGPLSEVAVYVLDAAP
jgi:RimJ/RimL family protein N-acetyltransferase